MTGDPQTLAFKEANHQKSAKYFAISISVLIVLFTLNHWSAVLLRRYGSRQKGALMNAGSACTRGVRSIMSRSVPSFNSTGHLTVYILYLVINIVLTFRNMDWYSLRNFGKRLGWMTIVNMCLVVFLSLKNTPLSFLTHYTYNTLNLLHRVSGYTTVVFAMSHMTIYIIADSQLGTLQSLTEWDIVAGMVSAGLMLFMALTAFFLRKNHYEIFYVLHIFMFTSLLVILGYHRPDLEDKVYIAVVFSSAIWFSDRLLRSTKILLFSFGNFATIVPLDNGGVRVFLQKAPRWAKAGEHVFLWIPTIRTFETHPFTIARLQDGGAEFVVAKQDGFTKKLHDFAVKNPGGSIRASVDGPYGYMPDFDSVDKVVLIAGGSGASYSAGVAVELAKRSPATLAIEFIWALRDESQLSWYSTELQELKAASNVTVRLYCTKLTSVSAGFSEKMDGSGHASISDVSSHLSDQDSDTIPVAMPSNHTDANNIEKSSRGSHTTSATLSSRHASLTQGFKIKSGRPNVGHLIRRNVEEAAKEERVMVCACGPTGMMRDIQGLVADLLIEKGGNGAGVEVHLETFGW